MFKVGMEKVVGNYGNIDYDFDRYDLETYSGLSTKEFSVIVDFKNNKITGECIAYGSWFDIEMEQCLFLINYLLNNKKIKRNFDHILDDIIKNW